MNKQQIEEFDKKFENIISADLCIRGHYVPTEDSDSRNKIKSFIEKTLSHQREEIREQLDYVVRSAKAINEHIHPSNIEDIIEELKANNQT